MVESNITRRRVLQGAGAIGVASFGSTVISAQEGGGQGGQSAAIRVAHASPDAPNVDVRLTSQDGGGGAGGTNQTDGNQTGGNETGGGQGGGDAPSVEGLAFRDVSSYNQLDPGSYQVEVVPAEGGLIEGFVEDLFGGGGDDEETVLFEDQIDVEQGTAYTLVAFGEVAQGPIPAEGGQMGGMAGNETGGAGLNETDGIGTDGNATGAGQNETDGLDVGGNETGAGQNETAGAGAGGGGGGGEQLVSELSFGDFETLDLEAGDYTLEFREAGAAGMAGGPEDDMAGNETGGLGQNETDGVGGNETGGADGGMSPQSGGSGQGFQVQVLEDDVSAPSDQGARLRVFHAVPDVETMSISRISDQGEAGGGGAGGAPGQNGTDGAGQDDGAGGAGQGEGGGAGAGDGAAGQNETAGGAGQGEGGGAGGPGGGAGGAGQEEGVRRASFSADENTVYSGFALGFFDPQAAATAGDGGDGGAPADQGNDSEGIGAGQQGDGGAGGNATGNQTGGGEQIAEDAEGEEFEFVTVEDAQGGERSDGGTGGLLDLAPPVDD